MIFKQNLRYPPPPSIPTLKANVSFVVWCLFSFRMSMSPFKSEQETTGQVWLSNDNVLTSKIVSSERWRLGIVSFNPGANNFLFLVATLRWWASLCVFLDDRGRSNFMAAISSWESCNGGAFSFCLPIVTGKGRPLSWLKYTSDVFGSNFFFNILLAILSPALPGYCSVSSTTLL